VPESLFLGPHSRALVSFHSFVAHSYTHFRIINQLLTFTLGEYVIEYDRVIPVVFRERSLKSIGYLMIG
jgi:hypothetical protein